MVKLQPSKLIMGVRFTLPAPFFPPVVGGSLKISYLLLVVGNRWDVAAFILMARRKTLSGAFSRMPVQPPLAGQVRELRSLEFSESLAVSGRQVIKAPLKGMHAAMHIVGWLAHGCRDEVPS